MSTYGRSHTSIALAVELSPTRGHSASSSKGQPKLSIELTNFLHMNWPKEIILAHQI